MISKQKSRALSTYEYYKILQIEWIVADLRFRIYPKKDKDYWNRVKEGKKKTIEEISEKNKLPTIFNDDEIKAHFEAKVYLPKGMAAFVYKNEEHRDCQEPLDMAYYFAKGAEVRFDKFGEQKIGVIKSYLPYQMNAIVKCEDEEFSVLVTELTRIL